MTYAGGFVHGERVIVSEMGEGYVDPSVMTDLYGPRRTHSWEGSAYVPVRFDTSEGHGYMAYRITSLCPHRGERVRRNHDFALPIMEAAWEGDEAIRYDPPRREGITLGSNRITLNYDTYTYDTDHRYNAFEYARRVAYNTRR